jgi:hypothetical protein
VSVRKAVKCLNWNTLDALSHAALQVSFIDSSQIARLISAFALHVSKVLPNTSNDPFSLPRRWLGNLLVKKEQN